MATYRELYTLGIGVQVNNRATSELQLIRREAQRAWTYVERLAKTLTNLNVGGGAAKGMAAQATAMERAAVAAASAAKSIASQARALTQGANAMQRAANAITRAQQPALSGGRHSSTYGIAMLGQAAGGAGVGMVGEGLKSAMDLEMILRNIQLSTNASDRQMRQIQQTAYDISNMTAQSVTDSARLLNVMASSGLNSTKQLLAISQPIAKFADVQYLGVHHTPFDQSAKWAIQIAHLYQAYTPDKIIPILDQLTRVSRMMPDDLGRYVTQAGYYMPVFRRLGVDENQSLILGAFIDRMGLGRGKGGTGLQNFLLQQLGALQLTGHMQAGRLGALQRLGLVDGHGQSRFYRNSHFDAIGSLQQIDEAIRARTRGLHGRALDLANQKAIVDIQRALNVQGGRIGFLGTKEAVAQLHQMRNLLKNLPDTDQSQKSLMETTWGQWRRFVTNFQSFLTDMMSPWLLDLRVTFSWLADVMHNMQAWIHQNREAAKFIAAALAGVSVAVLGAATAAIYGFASSIKALGTSAVLAATEIRLALAELRSQGVIPAGPGALPPGRSRLRGAARGAERIVGVAGGILGGGLAGFGIAQALGLNVTGQIWSTIAGAAILPIVERGLMMAAPVVATAVGGPIGLAIATAFVAAVPIAILAKRLYDAIHAHDPSPKYMRDMNVHAAIAAGRREIGGVEFARQYEHWGPGAPHAPIDQLHLPKMDFHGDVIINMPHGTTDEQVNALGHALVKHAARKWQSASRTQGDTATTHALPLDAGFLHVGSGTYP